MISAMIVSGLPRPASAATFQFNFGAGFSDSTPVAPIGGNTGQTLGAQRQIVLTEVAEVWGSIVQSSVTIVVDAQFTSMDCTPGAEKLAAAGTTSFSTNPSLFGNAVFFPRALEDALTGVDNDPGQSDITIEFNSLVDDGSCIAGQSFYYGLDDNVPGGKIGLYRIVLHQLAHGLGFESLVDELDGSYPFGIPSIFDLFIFDVEANEYWSDMTDEERLASLSNDPHIVWDGVNVTANASLFTSTGFGNGRLRLHAPSPFEAYASIHHFTDAAGPTDLLMEPQPGNTPFKQVDVTPYLLEDLGYTVNVDSDGDGVPNGVDNCPDDSNSDQSDLDNDGLGNVCDDDNDGDGDPNESDLDDDNDGLDDADEAVAGTDPLDPDSDDDGIGDALDDQPLTANNFCSGAGAFAFMESVVGPLTCAATVSITVTSLAEVLAGGDLQLIAPIIVFESGFSVIGLLAVTSGDPCPNCSP